MKRPITVSSSTTNGHNNPHGSRNSLTRNSTILNTTTTNTTGNSSLMTNNNMGMMNTTTGTTFTRPTFGNPVPMMINNSNSSTTTSSTSSSTTPFIPPNFQPQRNSMMMGSSSNSSVVNNNNYNRSSSSSNIANQSSSSTNQSAMNYGVEHRQQFIHPSSSSTTTKPHHQTFQRPQFSTPTNTQKRINNIPHSGLSTPKSGKKQPLHLVSCLSPTSTQLSTPNRSTQITPTTPTIVQGSKPTITPTSTSSSSSNTSTLYPFTSNNNHSFISNNNSTINNRTPPITTTSHHHARFVLPNYKQQEPVSRLQSSSTNLSDSQKENEEIEKLKAEIESLKGIVNKKNVENEELIKSKHEIEEQLLAVQSKIENPEENHQENSGMLDEDNDYILALLDDIDDEKMKDDKTESSQKEKEPETPNPNEEEKVTTTTVEDEKEIPRLPVEPPAKKISKKRIKWKNKNIADLQKDPVLHKAIYKLLIYKGNTESNPMDDMDTDEPTNEALSGKLWKAHRMISNDQSQMFLLIPILNAYLKRSHSEFDHELFICTLETILKLVLESEIFRSAFIESFSHETSFIELKLKKTIQENGHHSHPLFNNSNIIIPEPKKSLVKSKIRERKKYLHFYINSVPYQPDFIFDSTMDSILFNPEDIPVSDHDVTRTNLLSDLLGYFSSMPTYLLERGLDVYVYFTILEIVKTLAIWSPENALIHFKSLIDGPDVTIKNILGDNNVVLIQKSLEVLTILVKSEKIRLLLQQNNILTRVSAFLNVEIGSMEEMLKCRRMIFRLFHYLAFLCPDGISLLKEKHNDNNIVFDAMILLLRKELETIALLEEFSNESERIYLIRDIIVIFNHVSRLSGPIPYISPSLRLDYTYAKTTISIIREKSKFKEKFQLDEMK